jgi:phosphate transport system substrate-binding protein
MMTRSGTVAASMRHLSIRWLQVLLGAVALLVASSLSACTGGGTTPVKAPGTQPGGTPTGQVQAASQLTGAGATFPYPLYLKWFDVYEQQRGIRVNYQSIGSGGGIRQLIERTVDFGASDAVMTEDEERRAGGEVLHIPTIVGVVAVIYNLEGVERGLRLSPEALSAIFLGDIRKWDDPRIQDDNPDVDLPDRDIAVIYRSDGSGTTNIFTEYLAVASPEWADRVGAGKSVRWPRGLGAKGNEGVVGLVREIPGAIGYSELAYAVQTRLPYATLRNQAGNFVEPALEAATEAAAAAAPGMPDDLRASLVNAPGESSYPIVSFTWVLVRKEQTDPNRGRALVDLLWWSIHEGQQYARDLLYAPLPDEIVRKAEVLIESISHQGSPLYE